MCIHRNGRDSKSIGNYHISGLAPDTRQGYQQVMGLRHLAAILLYQDGAQTLDMFRLIAV
ncbi:hypothetical protein D3C74_439240 [compost metagenome]